MINLSPGQTFHSLTVVAFSNIIKRKARWLCRCACGQMTTAIASELRNGHTKSCGCLQKKVTSARNHKHGAVGNPEYQAWKHMKRRCFNKKSPDFHRYGGRGITVCAEWQHSFETFLQDVGPRPSPAHSLDRYPNNNGNYEPGNVRWATKTQQARNKRNNRILTIGHESLTAPEWSTQSGVPATTIKSRIKFGWNPYEAVFTKPHL